LVLLGKKAGPFLIKHSDFYFNNILFDDDYNITGILDWTRAQTVPCKSFIAGMEFIVLPEMPKVASAPILEFCDMVKRAWEERESEQENKNYTGPISDMIGSSRGDLIYFSYTFGTLYQAVAYARIIVPLLYSRDFSLETFRKHLRTG
jgi:hypothetical protein